MATTAATSQWEQQEAKLREFEARVDPSDPQQAALLEQMRQHTKLLQRSEWGKPERSARRNWNAAPRAKAPPALDDNYRAYKEHLAAEQQRLAGRQPPSALALLADVAEEEAGGQALSS